MDAFERIMGYTRLVDVFGYWPSFHDAEVVSIRLDRHGDAGPVLEALVHAFEMTRDVDAGGYFVLRHHVLVHLRFHEVVAPVLYGFNPQNMLYGILLTFPARRVLTRLPSWRKKKSVRTMEAELCMPIQSASNP